MQQPKKRGRPNNKQRQLNEQVIIYMAKALMREKGGVPSIRELSRALGIDAMAIYHYFENKNSLLNAVLLSLMDGIYLPQKKLQWQSSLQLLCESYLNLLNNYSGLLDILIAMPLDGPMHMFAERFNKIISPLNLPPQKQKNALLLLLNFVHGQALLFKAQTNKTEPLQNIYEPKTISIESDQAAFNEALSLYFKVII